MKGKKAATIAAVVVIIAAGLLLYLLRDKLGIKGLRKEATEQATERVEGPSEVDNMLKLARMGCIILPANPGFYHHPQTVQDMVDFVVARILDQLAIPNDLMPRWGEPAQSHE